MSATGEGTIAEVLAGAARWAVVCGDSATVDLPPCSIDAIITDPPAGIAFMGREWDHDKGGKEHWIEWLAGILRRGYAALKPGGHLVCWALPRTSHWTAEAIERAGFEIRDKVSHVFGSGFPKSLDVSKAIDAAKGVEREVLGWRKSDGGRTTAANPMDRDAGLTNSHDPITAPATPEAARWFGWGTALKPASEDWIIARRPLSGTVAANVMEHGTGALNIDACRVAWQSEADKSSGRPGAMPRSNGSIGTFATRDRSAEDPEAVQSSAGRWPANFILSHCAYPETECRACGLALPMAFRFCPACGAGDVAARMGGCCEVGSKTVRGAVLNDDREVGRRPGGFSDTGAGNGDPKPNGPQYGNADGLETVPAWACLATCDCGLSVLAESGGAAPRCQCGRAMRWACPVAALDEQSGASVSTTHDRGNGVLWSGATADLGERGASDSGGASRFFNTFAPDPYEPFFYAAKPSTAETEAGCDALPVRSAAENVDREEGSAGMQSPRAGAGRTSGRRNHHPTKKGLRLMRHFVRLTCPPGGVVLDLFGGSGTTGAAVAIEAGEGGKVPGARSILVEQDPEFVAIGRARIAYWKAGGSVDGPRVVGGAIVTAKPAAKKGPAPGQGAFDFGGAK